MKKRPILFFFAVFTGGGKMQRPQRNRKAPVPLYVPDPNQVMEDDFSDDDDDDDDEDGEDLETGSDVSYSGSEEENAYQYDDFLVPDDASVSEASADDDDDESSFSGSETEESEDEAESAGETGSDGSGDSAADESTDPTQAQPPAKKAKHE